MLYCKRSEDAYKVKRLDWYIIKKFLGTFFLALGLIISIAIIFDASEKIDDFIDTQAPFKAVILDYYLNFIPYFANLFSSLFVFIAVIFFTSKMAYNSEIVAMLSSGVSFRRILLPYMMAAAFITLFSFTLGYYIIPRANRVRIEFQDTYLKGSRRVKEHNIHRQLRPGVYMYVENFVLRKGTGYQFALEKFEGQKLVSKLNASRIQWDTTKQNWKVERYIIRDFTDTGHVIKRGLELDTTLNFKPEDLAQKDEYVSIMTARELDNYIEKQQMRGTSAVINSRLERAKRVAFPFSTFILTLIGVTLSSRRVRGGIGLHIGFGILLSFTYILFMRFADMFAISGVFYPEFAVWIPNIVYAIIGLVLYKYAPK